MVSGSPHVSNSFVSPYSNSFVSHSGWWWPVLRMSPIHLSPLIATRLSPSLAGGVRLSGCLQIHLSSFGDSSFVSQSGWWCPSWMSPIHLCSLIVSHLSPSLAGGVRLSGCRLLVASKVSQLLPSLLHLLSSFPPVSQMWSPSCLLDVSQVRLPRCCLPVASKVSTLVV